MLVVWPKHRPKQKTLKELDARDAERTMPAKALAAIKNIEAHAVKANALQAQDGKTEGNTYTDPSTGRVMWAIRVAEETKPILSRIEAVTAFAKGHLDGDHPDMPDIANGMLGMQCYQFNGLKERIAGYSKMIEQHALLSTDARRLMRMPGIGPTAVSAIIATIGDAKQYRTGRDFAAWLGFKPLNKSNGGKERLRKISKKGDRYIRKLLVVGMTSRAVMAKRSPEKADL